MVLVCEIETATGKLALFNAHLESRGSYDLRRRQLSELCTEIGRNSSQAHVMVGGDFNFDISREQAAMLISSTHLKNPFAQGNLPASVQRFRSFREKAIDWMLTDESLSISHAEIVDSVGASDHPPLCLNIKFT